MARKIIVRKLRSDEMDTWLDLRQKLWPDYADEVLKLEQLEILARSDHNCVLVADDGDNVLGFAEVSLREWAEGCTTHPVGYLEAWYVEADFRRTGVGRLLMEAAEAWARERGCTEMGSDADLSNHVSQTVHKRLGFTDIGSTVLFAKKLT